MRPLRSDERHKDWRHKVDHERTNGFAVASNSGRASPERDNNQYLCRYTAGS